MSKERINMKIDEVKLRNIIKTILLEEDQQNKAIDENLSKLCDFLGFKKSDLRSIAKKISTILKNYYIIHHQFQNISGSPEAQHNETIKLNNPGAQTYFHANSTILLNMIFSVLTRNVKGNVIDQITSKNLKHNNLRNVHKDPLGIALFIFPKTVDNKNVNFREFVDWHLENCVAEENHALFNELKVYTIKALDITNLDMKKIDEYFFQSTKISKNAIKNVENFIRKERKK